MKMAKAIRQQAETAERVAIATNDAVLAARCVIWRKRSAPRPIPSRRTRKEEEKMSFSIKAMCKHGELRPPPQDLARLPTQKAREMFRTGCYDIHIITPEGRDYASSEFADLPRTPVAQRSAGTNRLASR